MKEDKIIYFELNNWMNGDDYPDAEPFISWMDDTSDRDEDNSWTRDPKDFAKWCQDNELCIVYSLIDMSCNYCVSAKESWVKENCPELLTKYTEFIRELEDGQVTPHGRFGSHFKLYNKNNFGLWVEDPVGGGSIVWRYSNE